EGTYTIACQLGDTVSKLGVEVKKYVLPKFKLEVVADRLYYQPGQRVAGKLHAAYFFGKPVAEGSVELTLRGGPDKAKVDEKRTLKTDAKGSVEFTFPPLAESIVAQDKDAADVTLELVATVIDTAGQKQSRTLPVLVTRQPLRIEVIPEAGTLVKGL